jgi:hypothetical protein
VKNVSNRDHAGGKSPGLAARAADVESNTRKKVAQARIKVTGGTQQLFTGLTITRADLRRGCCSGTL